MTRPYRVFIVAVLVLMAYVLGGMTGYATGYNDKMVEKIVKYRGKR
jgi:membrane protein YqaA with SNARE-associated domain